MEFPHLQQAYEKYGKDGFEIIAVNVGRNDTPESIRNLFTQNRLTFTPVKNEPGTANDAAAAYRVRGCPTNYLVGRDGKIISRWVGFNPETGAAHLKEEFAKAGFK